MIIFKLLKRLPTFSCDKEMEREVVKLLKRYGFYSYKMPPFFPDIYAIRGKKEYRIELKLYKTKLDIKTAVSSYVGSSRGSKQWKDYLSRFPDFIYVFQLGRGKNFVLDSEFCLL